MYSVILIYLLQLSRVSVCMRVSECLSSRISTLTHITHIRKAKLDTAVFTSDQRNRKTSGSCNSRLLWDSFSDKDKAYFQAGRADSCGYICPGFEISAAEPGCTRNEYSSESHYLYQCLYLFNQQNDLSLYSDRRPGVTLNL